MYGANLEQLKELLNISCTLYRSSLAQGTPEHISFYVVLSPCAHMSAGALYLHSCCEVVEKLREMQENVFSIIFLVVSRLSFRKNCQGGGGGGAKVEC